MIIPNWDGDGRLVKADMASDETDFEKWAPI